MKKIGITGSIASGKTTASKILSARRGPLFSADKVVKRLYKRNKFKKLILKKFNIKNSIKFKNLLREKILKNNNNIKKLEMLIHPLVRKEMKKISLLNKYKKTTFYEIP
jgi:dephospho-CoA kinase